MGILITCQQCGKQYDILPRFSGRKVKCRRCRQTIRVPAPLDRPKVMHPSLIHFDTNAPTPPAEDSLPPTAEAVLHIVECPSCAKIHQLPEALPGKKSYVRCQCGQKLRMPAPRGQISTDEPSASADEYADEPIAAEKVDDFGTLEAELAVVDAPLAPTGRSGPLPPIKAPPKLPKPPKIKPKKSRSRPNQRHPLLSPWVWMIIAVVFAPVWLGFYAFWKANNLDLSQARDPFPLSSAPVPPMPELPASREIAPGVTFRSVVWGSGGGYPSTPGFGGTLWIYLPAGEHAAGSLPCVLIAPAGTNLLTGSDLGDEGENLEHLPYVQKGFAVVAYTLDGPVAGTPETASNQDFARAFSAFRDSFAGVVNGRNALEYVLARLPEVNPQRIYAAGHSSAGTVALLLTEHEPRIRACAAFAPCVNLESRLGELLKDPSASVILPGVKAFVIRSSPLTHVQNIKCPVFLFHALDDTNVPIGETTAFADQLRAQGTPVEMVTAQQGGHYDPMINEGIPQAIEWFQRLQ